jgi:hypothetical protein
MQDKQKSPPAKAVGPAVLPAKTERLREQAPEQTPAQALPRARRNFGSEQARVLKEECAFAAFAFLGLAVRALAA